MEYFLLAIAIVFELIASSLLKLTEGFTKPFWSCFCMLMYIICFYCFSKVLLKMNLSIAYALWCGVGIVVSTIISVFIYKESITGIGVLSIIMIVAGCVLLNLYGS